MKAILLITVITFLVCRFSKCGWAYFHGFKAGYKKGCEDEFERVKADMARVMTARAGK